MRHWNLEENQNRSFPLFSSKSPCSIFTSSFWSNILKKSSFLSFASKFSLVSINIMLNIKLKCHLWNAWNSTCFRFWSTFVLYIMRYSKYEMLKLNWLTKIWYCAVFFTLIIFLKLWCFNLDLTSHKQNKNATLWWGCKNKILKTHRIIHTQHKNIQKITLAIPSYLKYCTVCRHHVLSLWLEKCHSSVKWKQSRCTATHSFYANIFFLLVFTNSF